MMIWSGDRDSEIVVTARDMASLLGDVADHFAQGKGFTIATLNLDHVVKLRHDGAFRDAYCRHSHVTADGNPIVWLSKLAHQDVTLIPGSELIDPLCDLAARTAVPIALFGSNDSTLAKAGEALRLRYPGLDIALTRAPPMGFDPEAESADQFIAEIGASAARLCFLALGAPKQEILAARAGDALPNIGFVSIGAGLDFIAGTQSRAPKWVRAIAAEWLWRLLSNPRRLALRYGSCIAILPALFIQAFRSRAAAQKMSE